MADDETFDYLLASYKNLIEKTVVDDVVKQVTTDATENLYESLILEEVTAEEEKGEKEVPRKVRFNLPKPVYRRKRRRLKVYRWKRPREINELDSITGIGTQLPLGTPDEPSSKWTYLFALVGLGSVVYWFYKD